MRREGHEELFRASMCACDVEQWGLGPRVFVYLVLVHTTATVSRGRSLDPLARGRRDADGPADPVTLSRVSLSGWVKGF